MSILGIILDELEQQGQGYGQDGLPDPVVPPPPLVLPIPVNSTGQVYRNLTRTGTTSQWAGVTAPPPYSELMINSQTGELKVGDGESLFSELDALPDPSNWRVGKTYVNARARGMVANSAGAATANSALLDVLISENATIVFDHGGNSGEAQYYLNRTADFSGKHMDVQGQGVAGTVLRFTNGTPGLGNHGVMWDFAGGFDYAPRLDRIKLLCAWNAPANSAGLFLQQRTAGGQDSALRLNEVLIAKIGTNTWDIGMLFRGFPGSNVTSCQVNGIDTPLGDEPGGDREMSFGIKLEDYISGATKISPINVTFDKCRIFNADTCLSIDGFAEGGRWINGAMQYCRQGIKKGFTPIAPETRFLPQQYFTISNSHIAADEVCFEMPSGCQVFIHNNLWYLYRDTPYSDVYFVKLNGRAGTYADPVQRNYGVHINDNMFSANLIPAPKVVYGVWADEYSDVQVSGNTYLSVQQPHYFGPATVDCLVAPRQIAIDHPRADGSNPYDPALYVTDLGAGDGFLVSVTANTNVTFAMAADGTAVDTGALTATRQRSVASGGMRKGDLVHYENRTTGGQTVELRDAATGALLYNTVANDRVSLRWGGTAYVGVQKGSIV